MQFLGLIMSMNAVLPKNTGCQQGGYKGVHCAGGSGGAVRLASALSQCIADGCSAASKDGNEHGSRSPGDPQEHKRGPRVSVVASTEAVEDVAAPLRRCFTHELHIDAPDKDARLSILEVWTPCHSSFAALTMVLLSKCCLF